MKHQYDFIVCCEVMEHFYEPSKEFLNLFKLLTSKGKLFCKTHLFEKGTDFGKWYYKNDPSHVFIYQSKTVHWIKEMFEIDNVKISDRIITFSK